ncbi:hypothetical protein BN8_05722 [Fibrisoma limi BUZ 3]|uniref:T9SS type A sorting domain-containing protein n=1 Tax=Fibrisoma limi BUZ 3 TaxID=1185876 RepID=I2GR62_9BACT|nr:hypothetical protein BN8_05722 [Fibrisoma limi BUZ 3]
MNGRILYSYLFLWLFGVAALSESAAQSIVTGALADNSLCQGTSLTVPFSTTGAFTAGNIFSAQLSDPTGTFPANPTVIGTAIGSPSSGTTVANNTISAKIPANAAPGISYRIRVISSLPSRTSTNTQPLIINAVPGQPLTSTPSPYCEGATANPLSATASAGGVLNWYGTNAAGGTASLVAPTPNTNTIGTTNYYVSQTVSGCESSRASIPVTVRDAPSAPGTSPISYCQNETASPLSASPVSGATLNWYGTNATGGTASPVAPTPPTNTTGSSTYYVSQTLNGCESPRASLLVSTNAVPPAPTATSPAPYCEDAPATPLTASGQQLRWYGTSATGGTGSASPSVPNTDVVGTTNYYVTQTVNGCESPRRAIPVEVKPKPGAPATATVAPYCQNQTASPLSATATTGGTLNWYGTSATGGTASSVAPTPGTTTAGTVAYYVSQTVNGCESPRAAIQVTVRSRPAAPGTSPVGLCQDRSATPLTATPSAGGTLNWYGTNATGGTASTTAPTPPTSATGANTYYVSQTVNGCEGPRGSIGVTVNAIPSAPTAVTPTPYCEGTTAQPLSATGQSLKWYGTNGTNGNGSPTPSTPNTNLVGTTNYYVSQTVSGCESERKAIPVLVKDTPDRPSVSATDFCQNTTAPVLTATAQTSATLNWYGTSATGGTPSATAPTPQNTNVGTTAYYVSQTLDGCEGPRAALNVRVKATPGVPGVSPISFCNNGPSQPLTASGSNIKWYDAGDSPLGNTPTPNTGTVGTQVYKASQTSNEGCESPKAPLTVTINALPAAPGVSNVSYCQIQTDQPAQTVLPLQASGQNLKWYTAEGSPIANTPTPSVTQAGTFTYQVSQTVNNCEGGKANLQVTVNTTAAPTVAKTLITYCRDDQATPLEATAATGASLRWIDPYNVVTNEAPTPYTLNATKPGGETFFVYQINNATGCYSPRVPIKLIVNTVPTLSLQGSTQVNLGLTAPLQLQFTGTPPFSYTLSEGYSGVANRNDTTVNVLPRRNTTYQVVSVANSCGVGLPGNPATAIVSVIAPAVTTTSLAVTTLCAGSTFQVPFTTSGSFTSGNQFKVEIASTTDTSTYTEVSAFAGSSPITATLPRTLAGGQYIVRVKASNPSVPVLGTRSPTLLNVRPQPTATLTGTQSIYEGSPANLTVTFDGDGPWTIAYADSARTVNLPPVNSNPYLLEVRPTRTTTYRITSVSNNCGSGPVSGTATVTVQPLLAVEDDPLESLVKVYPVPTGTTLTVMVDLALNRQPAVLTLTDLRGRSVLQQTTRTRQTDLDLTSQPTGAYLLRIQVGDRQTVRKILKQ